MAPVFRALQTKRNITVKLIATGQHRELLEQVLNVFHLTPDYNLDVMRPAQTLTTLTSNLLLGLEKLFAHERPDMVLAHGDTTTCYTTALSAFYHSLPFYHVEAGLRTFLLDSPYPEEFNRQSVARLAHHHFAPTDVERKNLLGESIDSDNISITGSTIHDAIRFIRENRQVSALLPRPLQEKMDQFEQLAVVTLHRRENSSSSLSAVMRAIQGAAIAQPETLFVFPVHPNPAVKDLAQSIFANDSNVVLTQPLSYPKFLTLISRASVVLTDSGGVQEEAAYFGKRTLVLRNVSERADGFTRGYVRVVGTQPTHITEQICTELAQELFDFSARNDFHAEPISASQIIADVVEEKCLA